MNWQFWKRRPNPLDAESLRPLEALVRAGDLKGAAAELREIRDKRGDTPAVRYLEALVYHEGSAVEPATLLTHLEPVVDPARDLIRKGRGAAGLEVRVREEQLHGGINRSSK